MRSSSMQSDATRQKWICAIACLVIFFVALGRYWVFYDPTDTVPDNPEGFRTAVHLAETGHFANPFVPLDTGPSAHLAPALPSLLALLIHIYGEKTAGIYAIKWTATIVLCLQLALFPLFSTVLGMGALDGIVAALLWIVAKVGLGLPPNHQAVPMFGWESFYAALFIAFGVCCFRRYLDSPPDRSSWLPWALGGIAGILMLLCTTAGVLFFACLAWLLWRDRLRFFKGPQIAMILLPAIIVAPWLIRNYMVFHRFVPVRDNFGLELSVSNNDCARFGIQRNMNTGCFEQLHPNANIDEARKVLEEGEPAYNDRKLRETEHWIVRNPVRFAKLSAMRFVVFWLPTDTTSFFGPDRRLERFMIYGMTLLSLPGLLMLYRTDARSAAVCACCLALFPLIYYIVQFEYRYRYPILWVTFLLGALPIAVVVERVYDSLTMRLPMSDLLPSERRLRNAAETRGESA